MNRGFLTIAYGAPKYIRMGKALARSIKRYNENILVAVVTDRPDQEIKSLFDIVIPFDPSFGDGVKQKLYIDKYTPFEETIFVDSDCLIYRDPETLWELYKQYNKGFGIKGWSYLGPNDEHYSVRSLSKYLSKYKVSKIGAFNSGLFYFNQSEEAKSIFETARELCEDDELKPFKNSSLNDEPIFAMAMAINEVEIIPWDDGEAMSTPSGKIKQYLNINVLKGRNKFIKDGYIVNPIVIHFHIQCQDFFIYKRDIVRLELMYLPGISILANILSLPDYFLSRIKYYSTRISDRRNKYGLLGLIFMPERFVRSLSKLFMR